MTFSEAKKPRNKVNLFLLLSLVFLFSYIMMVRQHPTDDYTIHLTIVESIQFNVDFELLAPHFLYHIFVAIGRDLTSLPRQTISIILLAAANALTAYIAWRYASKTLKHLPSIAIVGLVSCIMVLAPASILRANISDPNFYWLYFHPTPYHNPTYLMAKPFVLLLALLSIRVFDSDKLSLKIQITLVATLILATLAKPNYIIAFLPALIVFATYFYLSKQKIQWKSLIFCLILPSIILIAWQFLFTYVGDTTANTGSIIIDPLVVMNAFLITSGLPSSFDIVINILLSLLFPLALILLYPEARKNKLLIFSWITFLMSLIQVTLLRETGERAFHGNFYWGAHFSIFVLYTVTAVVALKVYQNTDWRWRLLCTIFALHLISGLLWYLLSLSLPYFIGRVFW